MLEAGASRATRTSTLLPALAERLAAADFARCSVDELMHLAAACWSDVEVVGSLRGSSEFVWERLLHFGRRGYLTAQEEEGLRRTLARITSRAGPAASREVGTSSLEDVAGVG